MTPLQGLGLALLALLQTSEHATGPLAPLTVGSSVFLRRELANGLRAVAVHEEGTSASVFLVVGVGDRNESETTTGLAHLVEHAMFSGTARTGTDEHEHTVVGWGGESNAFTRADYTLYYDHSFPLEHLGEVLAMEADRLRGLTFEEEPVLHERERLSHEEERTYQEADGRDEALEAAVLRVHPYRFGVRDAQGHTHGPRLPIEAIRAFYDRHYHPRNLSVVVVTPGEPEAALALIEQAFGALPAGPEPERLPREPWPSAQRTERIPSNLPRDRVELVWIVPERGDPRRPIVKVLASWIDRLELGGGLTLSVELDERADRELLRLGTSGEGALEALQALAERVRDQAPPPEELEQVKSLLADVYVKLPLRARPYFSLAGTFGVYEVAHQAELLAGWKAAVEAVTPEQVLAVARELLAPERAVTVVFEGTGAPIEALPDEPSALAAAAADATDAGDYARAVEAYDKLLAGNPNRMNKVIYLTTRGQIRMEMRDYATAIQDFETALAVVEYPAVRELLEEAEARLASAMRGEFEEAAEAEPEQPAAVTATAEEAELQQSLVGQVEGCMRELESWRGLRFQSAVEPEFVHEASDAKLGGWYEPDTKRLVVVLSKGSAFSRGAQLHEIFHALQDQSWNLSALDEGARTTDQRNALQGLIEGEAMLAVSEILHYDFEQHAVLPSEGEIERARFEKVFHYGEGLRFVRSLRDAQQVGWPAVDAAWRRPPRSTAELYHPELYPLERPQVELPAPAGTILDEDVRGEFELRWLLTAAPETRASAPELAARLAADRWRLVERDGERREHWTLAFADEASAQRFEELSAPALARERWQAARAGALVRLERPANP